MDYDEWFHHTFLSISMVEGECKESVSKKQLQTAGEAILSIRLTIPWKWNWNLDFENVIRRSILWRWNTNLESGDRSDGDGTQPLNPSIDASIDRTQTFHPSIDASIDGTQTFLSVDRGVDRWKFRIHGFIRAKSAFLSVESQQTI